MCIRKIIHLTSGSFTRRLITGKWKSEVIVSWDHVKFVIFTRKENKEHVQWAYYSRILQLGFGVERSSILVISFCQCFFVAAESWVHYIMKSLYFTKKGWYFELPKVCRGGRQLMKPQELYYGTFVSGVKISSLSRFQSSLKREVITMSLPCVHGKYRVLPFFLVRKASAMATSFFSAFLCWSPEVAAVRGTELALPQVDHVSGFPI